MAAPMHKVPTDLQRRAASAVRQFPKGCADDKGVSKPDLAPLSPVESNSADDAASSTPMTAPISFNMPKDPSPEGVSENGADSETKKNLDVQLPANSRTPPRAWAVRVFPPACGPAAAAASVASGNKAGDVEGIMYVIKEFSGNGIKHCAEGVRDNADPSDKKTRIAVDVPKPNLTHLSPVKSNAAHAAASSKAVKSRTPPRGGAVLYFPSACWPAAAAVALVVPGNEAGDPKGIKDETKEFRGNAKKQCTKGVRDNAHSTDKNTGIVVDVSKPNLSQLSPVQLNITDAAASSAPMMKNGANFQTKKRIDVQLFTNSSRPRVGAFQDFTSACEPAAATVDSVVHSKEAGDVGGIKDEAKESRGNARKHSTKIFGDNGDSSDKKTRIVVQALMTAENCPWRRGKVAGDVEGIKDETKEDSGNDPRKLSTKSVRDNAVVSGNDTRKLSTKSVRDNAESSDNKGKIVVQALMAAETCPWRRVKGKIGVAAGSAPPKCR